MLPLENRVKGTSRLSVRDAIGQMTPERKISLANTIAAATKNGIPAIDIISDSLRDSDTFLAISAQHLMIADLRQREDPEPLLNNKQLDTIEEEFKIHNEERDEATRNRYKAALLLAELSQGLPELAIEPIRFSIAELMDTLE